MRAWEATLGVLSHLTCLVGFRLSLVCWLVVVCELWCWLNNHILAWTVKEVIISDLYQVYSCKSSWLLEEMYKHPHAFILHRRNTKYLSVFMFTPLGLFVISQCKQWSGPELKGNNTLLFPSLWTKLTKLQVSRNQYASGLGIKSVFLWHWLKCVLGSEYEKYQTLALSAF